MVTIDDNEMEMILNFISTYHTFKDISNDTIYTFIATVNPSHRLPKLFAKTKGLISRIDLIEIDDFSVVSDVAVSLRQKRLPSSLIIKDDDLNGILNKYRKYSSLGIPVFAESDICYDDEFTSLFWEWFYDRSGYRINIFADLLSKILLDYWGTIICLRLRIVLWA